MARSEHLCVISVSYTHLGVIQFASSAGKAVLYVLLIINIAVSLGVKESSVAALLGTAGVTVGLALQGGLARCV